MTDASTVRADRFNPDSPVWNDAEDGELWRISSPKGSPIEWRCTLRWHNGGWTQIVGLEFGPAVLGGFDIRWNDAARSGDPTSGKPVAFPAIDPEQLQEVVRTVVHAARDAEAARVVARATRAVARGERWDDWLKRLQGPEGDRVRHLDDASDPVQEQPPFTRSSMIAEWPTRPWPLPKSLCSRAPRRPASSAKLAIEGCLGPRAPAPPVSSATCRQRSARTRSHHEGLSHSTS